ncbi:MAG: 50S ribosomal protein L13 [Mycoplasmoidaceae bacterium]|nr:MAG: 50S ribosomal protein L13 [Mycoplasmoidaceae bacterium]
MQKTTMPKNEQMQASRKWYEVDATGVVLGDLAVIASNVIRGKNKPLFAPNTDCGDYLIVRNASKVKLTGKKMEDKMYYNHSLYIGGLRKRTAATMTEKYPEEMIHNAVKGMIPHTRLGRQIIKKLFVYGDEGESHSAQKPERIVIKNGYEPKN